MPDRHILARSMHDIGLAAWFGGSLMGAVGLNGAAASLRNPDERAAAATVGWTRWVPVSAAAIGIHLIGATQLLRTERGRIAKQDGVARSSAVKTGLTALALGTTAYSGVLNRKMVAAGHVPVQGATEPGPSTPADVARTQKQLQAVQWLIPGVTGALIGVTAWQSEQMRPKQVLLGLLPGGGLTGVGAGVALLAGLAGRRRARNPRRSSSPTAAVPLSRRDRRDQRRAERRLTRTSASAATGAAGPVGPTGPRGPAGPAGPAGGVVHGSQDLTKP